MARRAVVAFTSLVVRLVEMAMLAAASSLVLAAIFTSPFGDTGSAPWIRALSGAALRVAGVLAAAASVGFLLMPARREILRRFPETPASSGATAALLVLPVAAATQVPLLMYWWAEAAAGVAAFGSEPDPLGLRAIPTVLIFLLPALTSAALALFAAASLLSLAARADLTRRILGACAASEAGLVVSVYLLRSDLFRLGSAVLGILPATDPTTAQVAGWLARQDTLAASMSHRLVVLMLGSLAILVLWDALSPAVAVAVPADPAPVARVGPRAGLSSGWVHPNASSAFDQDLYTARPKMTMTESLMGGRYSQYEIQAVPPSSRKYFSFSWTTGILRQEPNGPGLVRLEPPSRPRRLLARSYRVMDAQIGATLGRVVPAGHDWEVFDAVGERIAEVREVSSGYAAATYVLNAGARQVCRYSWGLLGATVASAAIDVEFQPVPCTTTLRAVAMALMPILEQNARLWSEWCA